MAIALSVFAIFVMLCLSEFWWRKRKIHDEFARKFVHVTVGSFVAFWPFFMTWTQIELLSAAFVVAVVMSKYLNIFQAIHSVQRPTWGEVLFAVVVGALAFAAPHKGIYTAALLQMSLADGLAAVVGTRYGKSQTYNIFGHPKSVAGTTTFLIVSLIILALYCYLTPAHFGWQIPLLSLLATMLENLAVRGFDNLVVPLVVGVGLSLVR